MFNHPVTQALSLIWKLATVLIIPIIIILYIKIYGLYHPNFSFDDLDQGQNSHKWVIFAIYLFMLLAWNRLTPYVYKALKRMEY